MKFESNFGPSQDAKQSAREQLIDRFLNDLAKSKIKTTDLTALADLVANQISQAQGKSCVKSTLLRNPRYRIKLNTHYFETMRPGVQYMHDKPILDPVANATLTASRLEVSNLKSELKRLKLYTNSLETQINEARGRKHAPIATPLLSENESLHRMDDSEAKFIRTCQALRTVLSHFNPIIEVDVRRKCIIDKGKRRDNIVVDSQIATPFIEWLAMGL